MIVTAKVIKNNRTVIIIESENGYHRCSDGVFYKVGELKIIKYESYPKEKHHGTS